MRTQILHILIAMAAAIPCAALGATCESLADLKIPDTRITIAQQVTAGAFTPPVTKLDFSRGSYDKTPAFCRVAGVIQPTSDSNIQFEVWMPLEGWNRKFRGADNGGFAGSISYPALSAGVSLNYAVAATDTGHSGIDASWAPGHPEKVIDFGYRAMHETAVKGKAVVKAFYGAVPEHSYFFGCSNGGRQALMEAQRYPEDYDGIIAGAPANYWTHNFASFLWTLDTLTARGAFIPISKLNAIQAAAVAACDANDGVKDGVIDDPRTCHFDPASMLCNGPETLACLTGPQADALKRIYTGTRNAKGEKIYPGYLPGAEAEGGGWSAWITGSLPTFSLQIYLGSQFFGSMVLEKPFWGLLDFDLDRDVQLADRKLGMILNATDPNLRPFYDRGGKLILFHGWSDAAVAPENTVNYYQSVTHTMGQETADRFVRLFMVPGMEHCGDGPGTCWFGQANPTTPYDADHDIKLAMERWVEKGTAPDTIIASKPLAGGATRTRPLCVYPKVARWKGSGSTDDASNFVCKVPVD